MHRLVSVAVSAIGSYRPDRKAILITGLVLLVLLQPGFVLSILLISLLVGAVAFWCLGPERSVAVFSRLSDRFARLNPREARRWRARVWIAMRKWARLTGYLPPALAQHLQFPDFRATAEAEARHTAIVSDRLNRLSSGADIRGGL